MAKRNFYGEVEVWRGKYVFRTLAGSEAELRTRLRLAVEAWYRDQGVPAEFDEDGVNVLEMEPGVVFVDWDPLPVSFLDWDRAIEKGEGE